MILLWGIPGDAPMAAVREALEQSAAPFVFVDQFAVLDTDVTLAVSSSVTGGLRAPSIELDLAGIDAAYIRPYETSRVLAALGRDTDAERAHAADIDDALLLWCQLTPALVINRPSAMTSNASKPWQAALIAAAGFDVPETLVTTDPEQAAAFRQRHGRVVYKSISGIRSRVGLLDDERVARLVDTACPVQLQEAVAGTDVRVHVVGDQVFACEIRSGATDYRYPATGAEVPRLGPCWLPDEVRWRCLVLAHRLQLPVVGIDLRHGADGRWVCFEANPSPGFTYYEAETGQPIGRALADLLATHRLARANGSRQA